MEKITTGVSLGRFNPVMHKGHQRTIETMMANHGAENSLIMIGSSNKFDERNPLTYPQRRHLAQVLYPEVEIMPLPDQAEGDQDFYETMQAWQNALKAEADKRETDFCFYGGSEADVSYMQPDFETVVTGRSEVLPFSGTQVRAALEGAQADALSEMIDERVLGLMTRYYQFQVAQLLNPVKPFGPFHLNARATKPDIYPARERVADEQVFWEVSAPDYKPPYFVAPSVLSNDRTKFMNNLKALEAGKGWADPENWKEGALNRPSFFGTIQRSKEGKPLNPMGRTGIEGRGLLGKWGVNLAVDNLVTRLNPETGALELLIIQRPSGHWGFPGGFVDNGEDTLTALGRELQEETHLEVDMSEAELVYQGYVDSSRNTDNAWVETEARHHHLAADFNQIPMAGDDAQAVDWLDLSVANWADKLLDTHAHIVNAWLNNKDS